jgi:hypothetical protein
MKFHLHDPDAVLQWQPSHYSERKWDLAGGLPYSENGADGFRNRGLIQAHPGVKTGSPKT